MSDSGDYINTLKALAVGDDRILFTDFVDGALRDELYSNAYLFVLPSDLEGMPLSLLEAMSYGNCVLVSDIEECTNVIHDRGITFRKGDVNDLEAKLRYAIEHPNAVRMFKWLSSDYICDRFQWDKVVDADPEALPNDLNHPRPTGAAGGSVRFFSPGSPPSPR